MGKKFNLYLEFDNYYEGIATNDNSVVFKIDKEDYEKIRLISWYVNKKSENNWYMENKGKESLSVHRLVMDAKKGEYVDHINGDTLDNRKSNLRIVTKQQNGFNSKIRKNNTSGFVGVHFDNASNNWVATIKYSDKKTHLKKTKDKNEAIRLRLEAELKYFGKEFAPQRHLFEEYGIDISEADINE